MARQLPSPDETVSPLLCFAEAHAAAAPLRPPAGRLRGLYPSS